MVTFEEITRSFSNEHCGENLEYSQEFLALMRSLEYKPEQQFGDTIIEAESPEWSQAERQALALCEKTCDVRVLEMLARTWTAQRGLSGYADGLELVFKAISEFWDAIHPPLVEEDGYEDPFPRINALSALVTVDGILRILRSSPILSGNYGQLSLREAEQIIDGTKSDFPGGRARLAEMLSQAKIAQQAEINALYRAHQALSSIEAFVLEKLGHEWRPEFEHATQLLEVVVNLVGDVSVEALSDEVLGEEVGEQSTPGTHATPNLNKLEAPKAVSWKEVSISTRADAILALEKVSSYFEVHEPSHPAPYLIRRVQQTIPLNFYDMIKDLVPGSHEQFDVWLAKTENNDEH
ncbi:MAG: type VI secretion system protein TssA [Alcaligenaceae bacterium]|nr:type VI secretion system protein TssA [Alcaligenaceae bacterium]